MKKFVDLSKDYTCKLRELFNSVAYGLLVGFLGITLIVFLLSTAFSITGYIDLIGGTEKLGALTLAFNVILVAVTFVYVFFTYMILNQTADSEKRLFIEKRLQKLYYPLLQVLETEPHTEGMSDVLLFAHDNPSKVQILYELTTYSYLARTSHNKVIERVLFQMCKDGMFYSSNDDIILLKKIVNEDIEFYKNKLNEYIRN